MLALTRAEAKEVQMQQHTVFGQAFFTTELPTALAREAAARFDALWNLHPRAFLRIRQPSTQRLIALPRWQQAYGQDYAYSGRGNSRAPDCAAPGSWRGDRRHPRRDRRAAARSRGRSASPGRRRAP